MRKTQRKKQTIPVQSKPGAVKVYELEIGGSEFDRINLETALSSAGARHKEKVQKSSDQAREQAFGEDTIIPPISFEVLAELARINTWHKRCCALKAGVTVGLGMNTSDLPEAFQALANKANETGETLEEVLYNFQFDDEQFGNAYLEVVPSVNGKLIAELYHMPAHTVRCLVNKQGVVYGYEQMRAGKYAYFFKWGTDKKAVPANMASKMKNSVVHLKRYTSSSDYYGEPDYLPSLSAMGLDASAIRFNVKAFENELVIAFTIIVEGGSLGTDGTTAVKNFLKKNFQGVDNARRVLYLESSDPQVKIRIEKIQMDVKDSSFRFLRQDNRDEVIAAHGVPPRLLGIMNAAQLGGGGEGQQQLKIFKEILVNARQRRVENLVNNVLFPDMFKGKDATKFKLTELDTTVASEDAVYFASLLSVRPDLFTNEELREELGWPAVRPDGTLPAPVQPNPFGPFGANTDPAEIVKSLVNLRKMLDGARRGMRRV